SVFRRRYFTPQRIDNKEIVAQTLLFRFHGKTLFFSSVNSQGLIPESYDGLGSDDIGIFRASSGLWAIQGVTRAYFGGSSDIPVTR
ncbi:MAG: hypothetical protein U9N73_13100, partial [Candidatus Auribacterota bacterium]|nr:hypothetical protein [Candidatus Auribacterota bacterium]